MTDRPKSSRPVFDSIIEKAKLPERVGMFLKENAGDMLELATLLKEQGEASLELVSSPHPSVPNNYGDMERWSFAQRDAFRAMPQSNRKIQFDEAEATLNEFHKAYGQIARGGDVDEAALELLQGKKRTTIEVKSTNSEVVEATGAIRSLDGYLAHVKSLLEVAMTPDDEFAARVKKADALVSKIRGGIKQCQIDKAAEIYAVAAEGKRGAAVAP